MGYLGKRQLFVAQYAEIVKQGFLGKFIVESALVSALRATQFGIPFDKRPSKIEGYYKYQPGSQFIDKDAHVIEKTDCADIYSVMYVNPPSLEGYGQNNGNYY